MLRLIGQRLLQSVLVLLAMSLIIYALLGFMPGDPIDLMLNADPEMTAADAARLKALQGLDQPLLTRWWYWLSAALGGDFGYSRLYAQPIAVVLLPALGNTLLLLGASLLLALVVALLAALWAALKPHSLRDYLINALALAGISAPPFWLALMLISLFAVTLGWLPAGGRPAPAAGWSAFMRHLTLPMLTLAIAALGGYIRYLRGALLDVLHQDYIRTARAKGAGTGYILRRHALRNALLPLVTVLALDFGALFSGALIVETVYAWPGMGRLIYDSIMGNDYNLALAALLLATAVTLAGNLLADLLYGWLDPRIRYRQ
ncbi:MAG: ABC transporter permease [Candidatus Competibacterales bacterium]|nr:ABC transporter permease [Candidatus Competibacterales bacterium]